MTIRRCVLVAALIPLGLALTALAQTARPPATPPGAQTAAPPGAPKGMEPDVQPTVGDDKDTIEASQKWLKLLDDGKFGAAWDVAAPQLKSAVTRPKWITGIRDARKPFGKLASRTAMRFARAHQMPGVPDGDYSIIEFESTFANGKRAVEHMTWVLESGDVWRVAGYFIR